MTTPEQRAERKLTWRWEGDWCVVWEKHENRYGTVAARFHGLRAEQDAKDFCAIPALLQDVERLERENAELMKTAKDLAMLARKNMDTAERRTHVTRLAAYLFSPLRSEEPPHDD